jgi:hypothetical protein
MKNAKAVCNSKITVGVKLVIKIKVISKIYIKIFSGGRWKQLYNVLSKGFL